jgi:hypothetical protein
VTLELYPFRYRDPLTGRWVKARFKATREEIAARHEEWEITGPADARAPITGAFHPYRVLPHAELKRLEEPVPQMNPHGEQPPAIDRAECFLTALFLRCYVTYCARRRRYAQMQGPLACTVRSSRRSTYSGDFNRVAFSRTSWRRVAVSVAVDDPTRNALAVDRQTPQRRGVRQQARAS